MAIQKGEGKSNLNLKFGLTSKKPKGYWPFNGKKNKKSNVLKAGDTSILSSSATETNKNSKLNQYLKLWAVESQNVHYVRDHVTYFQKISKCCFFCSRVPHSKTKLYQELMKNMPDRTRLTSFDLIEPDSEQESI